MKKKYSIVFSITLFLPFLYFSFLSIFGISHQQGVNSNFYIFTVGFFNFLSLIIIGVYYFRKKVKLTYTNLLFYLIPLFFYLIYLIESPSNYAASRSFNMFLSFSLPGIFLGTFLGSNNFIHYIMKWIDIIVIVISVGTIISLPQIVRTDIINLGGVGYHSMSYFAALSYVLTLYLVLFGKNHQRFKYFNHNIINYIYVILIIFQLAAIFLSSGRGGFVTAILGTFVMFHYKLKKNFNFSKFLKFFFILLLAFFIIRSFVPSELEFLIDRGSQRVFSYISVRGVDLSETSGRDIVFSESIDFISEKPIIGYGFFSYIDNYIGKQYAYPHNFFLEVLLQRGVIYLFFWLTLFIIIYKKLKQGIKENDENLFILILSIYPITQLSVSGSYMMSGMFWFSISYIFNLKHLYKNRQMGKYRF